MLKRVPRFSRDNLDPKIKDVTTWATVEPSRLNEKQAARYKNLKEAISEYLAGGAVEDICKTKGISKPSLMRMVKRCIEPHSDGRIWGFRALILNTWQKQYERIVESNENTDSRHGGNSGNLSKLFDRYPDIKELVDILFLKKIEEGIVHESQIPFNSIHKRFLDKCRKEGIKPCSYPFTVKNLGYADCGNI